MMFERYGETVSLIRAGVTLAGQRGLTAPMDNSTTSVFFDANESVGLIRPALILYLDGATATVPDAADIFFRDGRLLTVRKFHNFRLSGVTVLILCLCD